MAGAVHNQRGAATFQLAAFTMTFPTDSINRRKLNPKLRTGKQQKEKVLLRRTREREFSLSQGAVWKVRSVCPLSSLFPFPHLEEESIAAFRWRVFGCEGEERH